MTNFGKNNMTRLGNEQMLHSEGCLAGMRTEQKK